MKTMTNLLGIWIGIVLCIVQSAFFSGLNLAVFNVSQLQLQIEADAGNADAARVLELRKNSNEVLATVIWGNVSINVLLTLLSNSVLAGVAAFLFAVVAITLLGEILPQAYFSRNALRVTTLLMPFLNLYRFVLYPLAKPTGLLLDWWLGKEGILYPAQRHIRFLIARSAAGWDDVGRLEAIGARNFLDLGEVLVTDEGEPVHSESIISAPLAGRGAILPKFNCSPEDSFLRQIDASGKRWVILTDLDGEPIFVLDSHHFLRDAFLKKSESKTSAYWHRPIIVRNMQTKLGEVIGQMTVEPKQPSDDVIHHDMILVWGEQKRVITGSDLLGRLLRDIAKVRASTVAPQVAIRPLDSIEPASDVPVALPAVRSEGAS
jgi:metal transporter CNNM